MILRGGKGFWREKGRSEAQNNGEGRYALSFGVCLVEVRPERIPGIIWRRGIRHKASWSRGQNNEGERRKEEGQNHIDSGRRRCQHRSWKKWKPWLLSGQGRLMSRCILGHLLWGRCSNKGKKLKRAFKFLFSQVTMRLIQSRVCHAQIWAKCEANKQRLKPLWSQT